MENELAFWGFLSCLVIGFFGFVMLWLDYNYKKGLESVANGTLLKTSEQCATRVITPKYSNGQWVEYKYGDSTLVGVVDGFRRSNLLNKDFAYYILENGRVNREVVEEGDVMRVTKTPDVILPQWEYHITIREDMRLGVSSQPTSERDQVYQSVVMDYSIKQFGSAKECADFILENETKLCKIINDSKCLNIKLIAEKLRRSEI